MIFGGDDKIKAEIVPNSSRQAKNLKMERMSICKQLSLNLFFKMSSKHKDPREVGRRRLPELHNLCKLCSNSWLKKSQIVQDKA